VIEEAWRKKGAEIEVEDNDRTLTRYASRENYRARVLVNLENEEVYIGGSGPCVDRP
jgi:hypothetical protein